MRSIFFLSSLFGLALAVSAATDNPVMCTMQYAPVCGTVQVQCITTPCDGVRQDFGNACMASAAKAVDITEGECESAPRALVTWAYDNALTRYVGVSDFGYERSLTRQEAAALIARAAEKVWGKRYASYPDNCNIAYTDETSFDVTLKDDIYSACAFDLMHGQDQRFSPTRTLSRAEALVIVMR